MVKYQLFESVIIAAIVVIFWTEAHGVILNDTNKTTVLSEASCICNVRQPEQFLSHGNHMICDFSASNKCYGLSDAYTENHKEWDSNKTNDYNMKTYSNIICEAIRNYYEKQWNGIPWHLMVVPFVINLILCSLAIVYQYLFTSGNCCSSGSVIHMRDDVISFKQMLREANSVCISDDSEKLISYNPQEKFKIRKDQDQSLLNSQMNLSNSPRNLGNYTGVQYNFPLVMETSSNLIITSAFEVYNFLIASGNFPSGTHNPYYSTAFNMRMDANGKVLNFKIYNYDTYTYSQCAQNSNYYIFCVFYAYSSLILTRQYYDLNGFSACYTSALYSYTFHSFDLSNSQLTLSVKATDGIGNIYHYKSYDTCNYNAFKYSYNCGYGNSIYVSRKASNSNSYEYEQIVCIASASAYNFNQSETWHASPVYDPTNTRNLIFMITIINQFSIGRTMQYVTDYKPSSMECTYTACGLIGYKAGSVLFALINGTDMTPIVWKTLSMSYTRGYITYSSTGVFFLTLTGTQIGSNSSYLSSMIEKISNDGLMKSYNCYEWNITDVSTIQASNALWSYSAWTSYCCYLNHGLYNATYVSVTIYERIDYINYYLNPDYQKTDSNGNTCSFRNPYIYSSMNTTYTYSSSTSYSSFYLQFLQEQGAPYNVTIEMADGSALSTPSDVVYRDYYYFNSYYRYDPSSYNYLTLMFNPNHHPVFYTPSITYQLNFKTFLINTTYSVVQNNFVNLTITNDPYIATTIQTQYPQIGVYHNFALDVQTNVSLSSLTIGCQYANGTAYGPCTRFAYDSKFIQIYETSNAYSGQTLNLQIYIYYYAAYTRYFNFTVIYDPSVGFASTSSQITVQYKDSSTIYNVTLPTFSMYGGATPVYALSIPSVPFIATFDSATRILAVTSLSSSYVGYTYSYFVYSANDVLPATAYDMYSFTVYVKAIPAPYYYFSSTTVTVYSQNYIQTSCPWFTLSSGTMSYNFTIVPSLPVTISTSNCTVTFNGFTNSNAGTYNMTIFAYDGSLPIPGQFSFSLTVNANQGPHNTTSIANQTFKSNTAKVYNITVPSSIFSDPESDPITYTMSVSPSASFLTCAANCTNITVTNPPNSSVGNYTVTLTANDGHSDTTNGTTSFNLEITTNTPPTKNTTILNTTFHGNRSTSYSFGSNLFYDLDGDTLVYTYSVSPTAAFLTVDVSSMSMTGFAANTDAGVYTITITANDDDPETSSATSSFNLTVVANQPPTTTQTISDISQLAWYPISIAWNSSLFSDINGDTIAFLITTNITGGWFTINNSYPNFTGNPSSNSCVGNYTVTLDAYDSYGGHSYYVVKLEVKYNHSPSVNQTWTSTLDVICLNPWQLDLTYAFYELDGEAINFIVNTTWLSIDNTTRLMTGTAPQVTTQTIIINVVAFDLSRLSTSQTISLKLNQNMPPVVVTQPTNPSCIFAHYQLLYSIPKSNFSEPENEIITYTYTTNDTTRDSWLSMTTNATDVTFSGTPVNSQNGSYIITLNLSDGHSPTVPNKTTTFIVCVNINHSPSVTGTPILVPNGQVGFNWSYNFDKSWAADPEGDIINYDCSYTTSPAWLSCSQNSTYIIFQGMPNSNTLVQSYSISVIINNTYSDIANTTWTNSFSITINNSPTIGAMANQVIQSPDGLTWSYGSTLTSDPENLSYTKVLQFNGSPTIPSWLTYNLASFDFSIVSTSNSIVGVYNITIIITDDYNPSVSKNFTLIISQNLPPVRIGFIQSTGVVNYNYLSVTFQPIDVLFQDPEGRPMTPQLTQVDGNPLPSFLAYNSINNTLFGTPTEVNVGDWLIAYIAIDDAGQSANTSFKVTVKPCYFKCTNCIEEDYNKCLGCKPGYYLQFRQCKAACEGNYFANPLTQTCDSCHPYCTQCMDSTQFNCQKCTLGMFYFNNGCYSVCPDGYYGDTTTLTCMKCNIGCTKCFGSSLKECTECNRDLLYIKSGASECIVASCIQGNYLNLTDLNCYPCDSGCISCQYPNNHNCLQCNSIYIMTTPGQCTFCNDVTGYRINEFGVCQEICGDGLDFGEFQCDDGNLINGDGCSNTCRIENGYTCKGIKCWEIIPPKASVISVSTNNLVTIKFNEPVLFNNYLLMTSNLKANINGPNSPYVFTFAVDNSNGALQANKSFTQMKVQISNIQNTIFGSGIERIELWLNDTSVIKDLANNSMSNGKIVGNLNHFEYTAPAVQSTVSSGGQSMQYTIMTMFSVNMLLKVVISSSAAVMWSLIHVLQLFRYILYINVNTPNIMATLISYLAIVVGDTGDTEKYIPDIIDQYMINSSDILANFTLYKKFDDNGYNSPFLIDIYSRKIIIIIFFLVLGVPAIFILMKLLHKVPFIGTKLKSIWSSLFFNSPIRTFTEIYIEMSFCFFLNTLNVTFMTFSGFISTTFMFCFGIFVLLWPFVVLQIICQPPKLIKSKKFDETCGTLIEDINIKGTLYQRSYYPLFIYGRLLVTGTLVMLYSYPVVQMFVILGLQTLMISFMIKVKPFTSQLQQVIAVSDEFTIIFGVLLMYWMHTSNGNLSLQNLIAFAIIGTVVVSMAKNMTIIFYTAITKSYSKFREWWYKKFNIRKLRRRRITQEKLNQQKAIQRQNDHNKIETSKANLKDLVENLQTLKHHNSFNVVIKLENEDSSKLSTSKVRISGSQNQKPRLSRRQNRKGKKEPIIAPADVFIRNPNKFELRAEDINEVDSGNNVESNAGEMSFRNKLKIQNLEQNEESKVNLTSKKHGDSIHRSTFADRVIEINSHHQRGRRTKADAQS